MTNITTEAYDHSAASLSGGDPNFNIRTFEEEDQSYLTKQNDIHNSESLFQCFLAFLFFTHYFLHDVCVNYKINHRGVRAVVGVGKTFGILKCTKKIFF